MQLSLSQEYYRERSDGYQQQYLNPGYTQHQQLQLDRAYETNFNYQEPKDSQDGPPKPFAYEYGGADKDGRHFAKTEKKDEEGVVTGEYRVELPDGRVQIVSYRADPELGYQADVRYEGEARPYVPEEEYQERRPYVPQHKPYKRVYWVAQSLHI